MKRSLLAAGAAATAVSALVAGGLAAVSPLQWHEPRTPTSPAPIVLTRDSTTAQRLALRGELAAEDGLFPGPLAVAPSAPPALPTSPPATPGVEPVATPTPTPHPIDQQPARIIVSTPAPRVAPPVQKPAPKPVPRPAPVAVPTVSGAKAYALSVVGSGQFSCLLPLWTRESNWNPRASNRSSGAYGIPQALPGGKMASAGSDWRTNPITQVKWGLSYINGRYGSPCAAWSFWQRHHWY